MFKHLQNHLNNLALNEECNAYRNTLNRSLRLAKLIIITFSMNTEATQKSMKSHK